MSCRGAVEEERVGGGPAVWEELPGHLLLSRQLQPLRRGLRVWGGTLPEHGGCVCHPRPLPLPWPGHPAGGALTHTHAHTHRLTPTKQTSAAQLIWQLVSIVPASLWRVSEPYHWHGVYVPSHSLPLCYLLIKKGLLEDEWHAPWATLHHNASPALSLINYVGSAVESRHSDRNWASLLGIIYVGDIIGL